MAARNHSRRGLHRNAGLPLQSAKADRADIAADPAARRAPHQRGVMHLFKSCASSPARQVLRCASQLLLLAVQRRDGAIDHRAQLGVVGGAYGGALHENDPDEPLGAVEEITRAGNAAPECITDAARECWPAISDSHWVDQTP